MNHAAAMTVANDESIVQLVNSAQRRLVVLAPGLSRAVAQAIGATWQRLGSEAVAVILDVDPEVCRLGYGEMDAVTHLNQVAMALGMMVNSHAGVRIGLIIADDATLIFAPTPLLIEAAPPHSHADAFGSGPTPPAVTKPNAIRLGLPPADVERDLGIGVDGVADRIIGLDKADNAAITRVEQDLKANPPQRFDISRSVRVFNARFEFVEIEIKGAALERKTVQLPHHMLGLADQQQLRECVQTSVKLLHDKSPISGRSLLEFRRRIIARYCTHLPGYGFVVLRCDKPKLERALARLARAVKRFREQARIDLERTLDQSREFLAKALAPRWQPPDGFEWFDIWTDTSREEVINEQLRRLFGSAEDLIHGISLHIVFKGVTYETLNDDRFVQLVQRRLPDLTKTHEEYDAAKAIEPPPPPPPPPALFDPPTPMKGAA